MRFNFAITFLKIKFDAKIMNSPNSNKYLRKENEGILKEG